MLHFMKKCCFMMMMKKVHRSEPRPVWKCTWPGANRSTVPDHDDVHNSYQMLTAGFFDGTANKVSILAPPEFCHALVAQVLRGFKSREAAFPRRAVDGLNKNCIENRSQEVGVSVRMTERFPVKETVEIPFKMREVLIF